MADKTAALRGGAADAPPPSARLATPAWLDQRDARPDANKARTAQVKRYFPGQAPQWQQQAHSSAAEGGGGQGDHASGWRADDGFGNRGAAPMHREVRPPEIVALPPRQATAATHIVDDDAVVAVEEEDEEAYARRRAAARARALAQREDEEPELGLGPGGNGGEERESGSTEWETDTDDEPETVQPVRRMIKPVFVPKAERESLALREAQVAEEETAAARAAEERAARAAESRAVAQALIAHEAALAAAAAEAPEADVDTDDEAHEAGDYDAWQARELGRVTRDRAVRQAAFEEREEMARLRAMSAEERAVYDAQREAELREEAQRQRDAKSKLGFMQKYYHKGAFFQSAADDKFDTVGTFEIYNRDFNAPTGEDRGVDRSALPKPMQVRKGLFGRAGQTKWTHLGAEDTSTKDDAWAKAAASTRAKLTGANAPLSKPKHLTR